MKVLWLTNIPSPYRVEFFNELGKLCELTVLFEKNSASDRDDSWKKLNIKHFKPVFLKGISHGVAEAFCPGVIRYLSKKRYDKIVVTNYANPTGILAVAILKLKRIPYIIESDGAFAGTGKGFKERVKRWLLKKSHLCFSTADIHDEYYTKYGVAKDRIVRYPFTSLHESDILSTPILEKQKNELREKLGVVEKKMVVAVGQFIPRKGFDVLINAMAKVDEGIGCYIIGGIPTEEYIEQVSSLGLKNVHFEGFKSKDTLSEYYMAADIFVLPTREDIWGLVVNEAMAKGLPVITTDRCVAGLALVTSQEVGKIISVENVDALATAIEETMQRLNVTMNESVLRTVKDYTFERMAEVHIEVFENDK